MRVDLKNTFKIHPKRSKLIILATLRYFNKNRGRTRFPHTMRVDLEKKRSKSTPSVQYWPFQPPWDILTKIGVETDSPTPYLHKEGGFKNNVPNQLPSVRYCSYQPPCNSALFDVDSTGFWTIDFFHPQLWEWLQGVVYADRRNGFRESHSALFDVDSTSFWSIFFNPQLWGWLQGVVGVLHPSY